MSKRQTTNVLLASLMMSFTTGIVHGEDHPFVFVDLPLPDGYTIDADSQVDISPAGDVIASIMTGGPETSVLAVWKDDEYAFTPAPVPGGTHDTVIARQINNAGVVIGQARNVNSNVVQAFLWHETEGYDFPIGTRSSAYDVENGILPDVVGEYKLGLLPVAFVGGSPFELLGLSGGTAECALGLNPDPTAALYIAGVSSKNQDKLHAVVWNNVNNVPIDLSPSPSDDHVAWQVNDSGNVIGYKADANAIPIEGYFWEQSAGVWTQYTLSDIVRPWGMNAYDEVVGDGSSATEAWLRVKGPAGDVPIALHDAVGIPAGTIHSFRVSSINDSGEIAGVIDYTADAIRTVVPFKLVPFNVDNDDGVDAVTGPDYRQVIDEQSSGNWIPDGYEGLRVGLHAPNVVSRELDGTRVVRFIRTSQQIDNILTNFADCDTECTGLTNWGFNGGVNDEFQKEIIITFRTPRPGEPTEDRVPIDPLVRADILNKTREFCFLLADAFDYAQIGNEVWSRAGKYFIETGSGIACDNAEDRLWQSVPQNCLGEVTPFITGWWGEQVKAARDGSALAGRPLRIIGPAVTNREIVEGVGGDCLGQGPNSNKLSFAVDAIIEFANDHDAALDVHYHFFDHIADVENVHAKLFDPNECWDKPNEWVTLEFGPQPSDDGPNNWWDQHAANTALFVDGNCATWPAVPDIDKWNGENEWVDFWLDTDILFTIWSTGMLGGFEFLDDNQYGLACYGPTEQTGAIVDKFDMGAIVPSRVEHLDIVSACAGPAWTDHWKSEYETASTNSRFSFVVFQPHPRPCSNTICP